MQCAPSRDIPARLAVDPLYVCPTYESYRSIPTPPPLPSPPSGMLRFWRLSPHAENRPRYDAIPLGDSALFLLMQSNSFYGCLCVSCHTACVLGMIRGNLVFPTGHSVAIRKCLYRLIPEESRYGSKGRLMAPSIPRLQAIAYLARAYRQDRITCLGCNPVQSVMFTKGYSGLSLERL